MSTSHRSGLPPQKPPFLSMRHSNSVVFKRSHETLGYLLQVLLITMAEPFLVD
jgi:hypothetical protein